MDFYRVTQKEDGSFVGFCSGAGKERWEELHDSYNYAPATREQAEAWAAEQGQKLEDMGTQFVEESKVLAKNRERRQTTSIPPE